MAQVHPDWQLVLDLGGPLKVAALLDYTKEGSVQRVFNWKTRGIPALVKVQHPELFLRSLAMTGGAVSPGSPAAASPSG